MKNTRIGFIGLGNMGYHMATHLANNEHSLVIYDVRREVLDSFEQDVQAEDILKAHSPQEVADEAEIILASLPTPQVVREVVLGERGVIHGKKVKTYIDLSTSGQKVTSEVGLALQGRGITMLDSPVSGGVPGAQKGSLSLMVAGSREAYERSLTLLEHIGKKIFYVGDEVGQAQVIKVINNLLSSAALAITSEAMVLGVKAGLDPNIMIDILNASSGRNSATEDKFKKSIINRRFDYGFKTDLAYKDIKFCLDLADDLEVPMWLGSQVEHFWRFAMSQGAKNQDYTTIIRYFEQWAGVQVGNEIDQKS
ncbi:NAD(P)-dependent oxidoreductase [Bacillus horti]|uniref:2-hydroxy-3-oxopropionate reductase n=1 Tax=Caldalkalibacillus horti TaxID=77523 RepID=A0ABT9W595_9BACI|nr:NAD(P)-dependent oxidoreductase [Bacillus horti]MDQ0168415.1 2-hydroxy-3-oxopropionate reductase [Bacillus horti]